MKQNDLSKEATAHPLDDYFKFFSYLLEHNVMLYVNLLHDLKVLELSLIHI